LTFLSIKSMLPVDPLEIISGDGSGSSF